MDSRANRKSNSQITFEGAQEDARANRWRPPIASMYGAYCRGWLRVKPLPEHVDWADW